MKINKCKNTNFAIFSLKNKLKIAILSFIILIIVGEDRVFSFERRKNKTKNNKRFSSVQCQTSLTCSDWSCKNGNEKASSNFIPQTKKAELINAINNMRIKTFKQPIIEGLSANNLIKLYWSNTLFENATNYAKCCPAPKDPHSPEEYRRDKSNRKEGFAGEVVFYEKVPKEMVSNIQEAQNGNFVNMLDEISRQALANLSENNPTANEKKEDVKSIVEKYDSTIADKYPHMANFLQIVNAKTYRFACSFALCQYGDDQYYKVYVCLFNKGLMTGSKIFSDNAGQLDITQFEPKEENPLYIPKGKGSVVQLPKDFVINFPPEVVFEKSEKRKRINRKYKIKK